MYLFPHKLISSCVEFALYANFTITFITCIGTSTNILISNHFAIFNTNVRRRFTKIEQYPRPHARAQIQYVHPTC